MTPPIGYGSRWDCETEIEEQRREIEALETDFQDLRDLVRTEIHALRKTEKEVVITRHGWDKIMKEVK